MSLQASQIRTNRSDRQIVLATALQFAPAGIYVEVGTHHGDFAIDILENCRPSKLYCVDPYRRYDGFDDAINDEPLDEVFAATKARLAPYGDQAEILRLPSVEAAARFADESVDFIYIDGNHGYAYALQDFTAWFPKLKQRGLMCGDDAIDTGDDSLRNAQGNVARVWKRNDKGEPTVWGHYGVLKAAREFCQQHNLQLLQTGIQVLMFKGASVRQG